MLDLSNKYDVSGMFSKAGRVTYERHNILHKRDDILNDDNKPKNATKIPNIVNKTDNNPMNKFSKIKPKESPIMPFDLNKEDVEKENDNKSSKFLQKQPFFFHTSHYDYKKEEFNAPPVGMYNPRYDVILPKVPSMKIKKKRKHKKLQQLLDPIISKNQSQHQSMPNLITEENVHSDPFLTAPKISQNPHKKST